MSLLLDHNYRGVLSSEVWFLQCQYCTDVLLVTLVNPQLCAIYKLNISMGIDTGIPAAVYLTQLYHYQCLQCLHDIQHCLKTLSSTMSSQKTKTTMRHAFTCLLKLSKCKKCDTISTNITSLHESIIHAFAVGVAMGIIKHTVAIIGVQHSMDAVYGMGCGRTAT